MEEMAELLGRFPRAGRVEWIGVAEASRAAVRSVDQVEIREGTGIEGEHHARGGTSKRQVTLIQAEHLPALAALTAREQVTPELLRRNIVVSGINLLALKDREFRIGTARLCGSGLCVPCSRMEENLGPGGYNAMRGHGGITTVVVSEGVVAVGDPVISME